MHIQYITFGLDKHFCHSCLHANGKNIYWFKKLVSAPFGGCEFSVRVKSLVLQSLTSAEAAVHKKHQFRETNKDGNKIKMKIQQVYMNVTRYIVSSSLYMIIV